MAALQAVTDGKLIPIDRAVILVGRAGDCDAVIMGSRKISRKHCCLIQADDQYLVRDLGSMNGVRINGIRVNREAEMKSGDRVSIGDVEFLFDLQTRSESVGQQGFPQKNTGKRALPVAPVAGSHSASDSVEVIGSIELIEAVGPREIIDSVRSPDDSADVDQGSTPPDGFKPARRDRPGSEPIIDLDDSFADEDIEDILTFDDD